MSLRSEMMAYHEMMRRNHLRVYFPRLVHAGQGVTDLSELPDEVSGWVGPGNECDVIVSSDEGQSIFDWMHSPSVLRYSFAHRMEDLMVLVIRGLREFGVAHQEALCKNMSIFGIFLTLDTLVFGDNAERLGPWNPDRGIFSAFEKTRDGSDAFTFIESIWSTGPEWVRSPDGMFAVARARAFDERTLSENARVRRGEFPCFLQPDVEYAKISWTTWGAYTQFDAVLKNG